MAVNPFMGRGGVGVPLQLRQTGGGIAPQVTARGRQLQSSPPPIPQGSGVGAGMTGLGKALGDIAGVIKESRQQANRKALIDSLVSDTDVDQGDAFDAAPMTMLGEDEMFGDDEGNIPTTAPTPVARPSKKINKMEAEGIPPKAQNAIRRYQQSGNYDEAFKIYNTFAMKEPTTYNLRMGEVVKDAEGNLIASGMPKDTRSNLLKGYQDALRFGYKGSIEDFAKINKGGTNIKIGDQVKLPTPPDGYFYKPTYDENGNIVSVESVRMGGVTNKADRKEKQSLQTQLDRSRPVFRDINLTLKLLDNPATFAGMNITSGLGGKIFSNIPTSTAETLQNTVAGIGSFISSDSLQQMRRDSPTGGALGNSSDADLQLLRDAHGRMNPFGDPQILKRQLRDFKQLLTEVIARNRAKAMEIGGKSGADLENAVTVNSESNLSKADRIVNFKPRNK